MISCVTIRMPLTARPLSRAVCAGRLLILHALPWRPTVVALQQLVHQLSVVSSPDHLLFWLGPLASVARLAHGEIDVPATRACPISIDTSDGSLPLAPAALGTCSNCSTSPTFEHGLRLRPLAPVARFAHREVHILALHASPISIDPCHRCTARGTAGVLLEILLWLRHLAAVARVSDGEVDI